MKKNLLLFITILLKINVFAQDIVFSQMQPNPALLNPAWQANRSRVYPYQVSAQYRNQWSPILGAAAYRSFAATVDANWKHKSYNYWGGGIQFCQDQAGKTDFTQTQTTISGLYSKFMATSFGGKSLLHHYLTLGAAVGFRQYRVDESQLKWVEQFEQNGVFNGNLPAPVFLENNSKKVEEVNIGLLWHANNAEKEGFDCGFSLFHLTKPNLSLVKDGNMPLNRRIAIHGSAYHDIQAYSLRLKYYVAWLKQGAVQQTLIGMQVGIPLKKQLEQWSGGLAFRKSQGVFGDAVIASLNLDFQDYTLVMNYDWNISSLNQANRFNNAIEFAFVYKIKN
jgi:type IX secretion system PorP/SprF family membrane protein